MQGCSVDCCMDFARAGGLGSCLLDIDSRIFWNTNTFLLAQDFGLIKKISSISISKVGSADLEAPVLGKNFSALDKQALVDRKLYRI